MKSVILIVPYIGKWPLWFEAHLVSIAQNPTIDWLFITDCGIPENYPDNVRFVPSTLELLNFKINKSLGIEVPLSPRKFCDVRPAYGKIFQEYISEYDFWGFCDVDIIWGDIRKFVADDILLNYDIISSRKEAISGHFTLFKNTPVNNDIYLSIPDYNYLLEQKRYMWGEELVLTKYLNSLENTFKVYWKEYLVNNVNGKAHQEYYLDKWLWKNGNMLEVKNEGPINEVMYLHFINWKRTMKYCAIKYIEKPVQFYISYNGMHYQPHSQIEKRLNGFKNLFDGYYVLIRRIKLMKKIMSLKKRVKNRLTRI